jgi:hypothetical protein
MASDSPFIHCGEAKPSPYIALRPLTLTTPAIEHGHTPKTLNHDDSKPRTKWKAQGAVYPREQAQPWESQQC